MVKRLLFWLVILVGGVLFPFSLKVGAVVKESGDLRIEHDEPIFPSTEIWFPGKALTKSVVVTNLSGTENHSVGLRIDITDDSVLSDVLSLVVRYGMATLWGPGSLRDLAEEGEVFLSTLGPGGSVSYDLTVSLSSQAGNDYQDKKTVLDFIFGFIEAVPTSTPTPTPTPVSVSTFLTSPSSPPSPPVCSAAAPGAPQNLTAVSGGVGEVILSWTPPSGTVTHYLIAYGTSSGNYSFGNPNVGKVTSYTVSGLSSGVSYYFVVKGVNDCAPGPFSNEVVAVAGGVRGAVTAAGPAVGFETLGLSQEAAAEGEIGGGVSTEAGETAGVKTEKRCFWWLILSLGAVLGSWLKLRKRKKKEKKDLLIPLLFSLLAFWGDRLAHQWFLPSYFCQWMWFWALLSFIMGGLFWWRKKG